MTAYSTFQIRAGTCTATVHVRYDAAGDYIEEVIEQAAAIARAENREADIYSAVKDGGGTVIDWERIGIRCTG